MVDEQMKMPGAPEECYSAAGLNNNRCIVILQWNMVIVRMGQDGNINDAGKVYGRFLQMIGEALQ